MTRARMLTVAVLTLALLASGCGGKTRQDKDAHTGSFARTTDTTTCVEDAKPYAGATPANYAVHFPLPAGAVLYDLEDRGTDGAIGTAVVRADLKQVLAAFNGEAQRRGYKITEGETETHDAEANWTGNGYRGRWSIRDSATCPGQVVIQLLSKKQ